MDHISTNATFPTPNPLIPALRGGYRSVRLRLRLRPGADR